MKKQNIDDSTATSVLTPAETTDNNAPDLQPEKLVSQALDLLTMVFDELAIGQDVAELLDGIKQRLDALNTHLNPQDHDLN